MSVPFIDLKAQFKALEGDIRKRIDTVLEHGFFINGPEVAESEKALSTYLNCKHTIACASGTDALLMALMAKGIQPGDEVITTCFSFIATAEVIVLAGATPVYVDINPATYNLDLAEVEKAISAKTKAIIPVALYGQPADMDEINSLAKKYNLTVIEDAAQSFGATYKNAKSGILSEIGTTSFFPAKPLGCYGDGGAIFTNSDEVAQSLREVRDHGSSARYHHTRIGLNGRMDSIQCGILLSKLERFPWEIEQRQKWAQRYNEAFSSLDNIKVPVVKEDRTSAWAQYTLQVPQRDEFQKKLKEKGIPTAVHYPKMMPDQPAYKELGRSVGDLTQGRKASLEVVSLPIYPDMTEQIQDQVIDAVKSAF